MPKLLLIVGPQAVGKMTVGQELTKITGYKLLHNHMTIEIVRLIFDYSKESYLKMNKTLRYEMLKEFASSDQEGIIFTGCLDFGHDLEEELEELNSWIELFDDYMVVELETTLEERLKRNKTENRLNNKPSKRDLEWSENDIYKSLEKHKLNSDPGQAEKLFKNYLRINNTNISAEKTAKMIKDKFKL